MTTFLNRHQVSIYLAALALGLLAAQAPQAAQLADTLLTPSLAGLMLVTFLGVPLGQTLTRTQPPGFTRQLLALNFLLAPTLTLLLLQTSQTLTADHIPDALLATAALILLAPCIDYVLVFTKISGGDQASLLAATPLLLAGQAISIPLWLAAYQALGLWETKLLSLDLLAPVLPQILQALATILVPLGIAAALQKIGGKTSKRAENLAETLMVPLMVLVLTSTTAAHSSNLSQDIAQLTALISIYSLYAALAWASSWALTRQQPQAQRLALSYSTTTRNALVILPLALALSQSLEGHTAAQLIPLAVMAQTLVELLALTLISGYQRRHGTKNPALP